VTLVPEVMIPSAGVRDTTADVTGARTLSATLLLTIPLGVRPFVTRTVKVPVSDVSVLVIVYVADVADESDTLALLVASPQIFLKLVDVFGNHTAGSTHDGFGAAVILLEPKGVELGVIFLKIEDVLDVRPPKSVNTLGVISHDADILIICG
jgi:hypothetical protein